LGLCGGEAFPIICGADASERGPPAKVLLLGSACAGIEKRPVLVVVVACCCACFGLLGRVYCEFSFFSPKIDDGRGWAGSVAGGWLIDAAVGG